MADTLCQRQALRFLLCDFQGNSLHDERLFGTVVGKLIDCQRLYILQEHRIGPALVLGARHQNVDPVAGQNEAGGA